MSNFRKKVLKEFSVLIVGCGNIAGRFDNENKDNKFSLTHADAFKKHGSFNLTACVDPDIDRLKYFKKRWNIRNSYNSLDEVLKTNESYDVVSICSPANLHSLHLQAVLDLKPSLVFCEKPLTNNLIEARNLVKKLEKNNILLAVNYSRRWMPDLESFRKDLLNGKWGKIRSIVGHYNKGLLNNGSHMIDLLHFLIGSFTPIWAGQPLFDFTDDDPSIPVVCSSKEVSNIFLNVTDAADYSFFEVSFYMEGGVVAMKNGGQNWNIRERIDHKVYKGYKTLSSVKNQPAYYNITMNKAVENIFDALSGDVELKSDGKNAIQAQEVCENIKDLSEKKYISYYE